LSSGNEKIPVRRGMVRGAGCSPIHHPVNLPLPNPEDYILSVLSPEDRLDAAFIQKVLMTLAYHTT
jgi:hypothetical protein